MHLEQIGPYRIVGRLGKGGMGTVFQAVHLETSEPAAVKLLSANLAEVEGFRERFESEIEALKKFHHPNIIRLLGFGEQDRQLYYAMEMIAGRSLEDELVQGRRFDCREVVRIAIEVCKALRHAHDRGIIHRDIKPGNLLLGTEGNVKIADFGIARLFGNSKLTVAGSIIGTAEYMAPEQAAGKPVEPRSDLYSLGAVMYVLLARRPLFKGKSLREVLHKQQYEIPEPLRHFNPDVPEPLERLIAQLLEKEPERRIPNAMVLSRVLDSMQRAFAEPGETIAADASPLSSKEAPGARAASSPLPLGEGPGVRASSNLDKNSAAKEDDSDSNNKQSDETNPPAPDCPATSDFAAPPPHRPPAYVEPSSNPLAPTIAATAIPILEIEPDIKEKVKPAGRFIPVSEDELGRVETEEPRPVFSVSTVVLIVALLAIGGGMWYSLQPPTADGLYDRIMSRIGDESIDSLKTAEDDIRNFLNEFSGDPRAEKIRTYEREIELDALERKLTRAVDLTAIEQAYVDAINFASNDPEQTAAKLQALIDLHSTVDSEFLPVNQCVELAKRHLKHLREEIAVHAASQLPLIQNRLDEADFLKTTDPKRAAAIYRAVIELYSSKSWAAPAIERAKAALEPQEKK